MHEASPPTVAYRPPIPMPVSAIVECDERYVQRSSRAIIAPVLQVDDLRTQIDAALHDNYLATTPPPSTPVIEREKDLYADIVVPLT